MPPTSPLQPIPHTARFATPAARQPMTAAPIQLNLDSVSMSNHANNLMGFDSQRPSDYTFDQHVLSSRVLFVLSLYKTLS